MNHHVRERAIFVQTTPAMRCRLAQAIEDLIALMDSLDGDTDLEEEPDDEAGGDDEPSIGWAEPEARHNRYPSAFILDAEDEHDGAEPEDGY